MANGSKEKAIIDFLLTCSDIADTPLYFNFINAKDNNKQFITLANDKRTNTEYVDGSVLKQFTFTIVDFKSITYNALVYQQGGTLLEPTVKVDDRNENLNEYLDVQSLIDWVTEQSKLQNYPDFGEQCLVQDMRVLTDNPNLNGVDTNVKPALAKYSLSIQVDYVDVTGNIWNN